MRTTLARETDPKSEHAQVRIPVSRSMASVQPLILQFRLCDANVNGAASEACAALLRLCVARSTRLRGARNVHRSSMQSKNEKPGIRTRARIDDLRRPSVGMDLSRGPVWPAPFFSESRRAIHLTPRGSCAERNGAAQLPIDPSIHTLPEAPIASPGADRPDRVHHQRPEIPSIREKTQVTQDRVPS
jgi:hypothetical protein